MFDFAHELSHSAFRTAGNCTATANGAAVDVTNDIDTLVVNVNVGAPTAGTNPTYDFKVQTSDDGVTWTDTGVAIVEAAAASFQTLSLSKRALSAKIRFVETIGGTNAPSFPVSAELIVRKQSY